MTATQAPLRIVVVEPRPVVSAGLGVALGELRCELVATCADGDQALRAVHDRSPEIAVVALDLPGESGIALTQRLLEQAPRLGVVLLARDAVAATWDQARKAGARALVLEDGPLAELREAVAAAFAGEDHVDARVRGRGRQGTALTAREREVLTLLTQGMTAMQVARHLFLGVETIRTHVRNAMGKLGARTRIQAVVLALRSGELDARPRASEEADRPPQKRR